MEIVNICRNHVFNSKESNKEQNSRSALLKENLHKLTSADSQTLKVYFAPKIAFKGAAPQAQMSLYLFDKTEHKNNVAPANQIETLQIKINTNNVKNPAIYRYDPNDFKMNVFNVEQIKALNTETARLDKQVQAAKEAQAIYGTFTQQEIDRVFETAALYATRHAKPLAQAAVAETGKGNVPDKVLKNVAATAGAVIRYKDMKTKGLIENHKQDKISVVAEPLGVVVGVVPVTNPTATSMLKALFALKTGNAFIASPHPSAINCSTQAIETVKTKAMETAKAIAKKKGFSKEQVNKLDGLIQTFSMSSELAQKLGNEDAGPVGLKLTNELMSHKNVNLVVATGGSPLVIAANKSGNPAVGVGQGATPIIIDDTALEKEKDGKTLLEKAVRDISISKKFDNGVLCTGEQVMFVTDKAYNGTKAELIKNGALIIENEADRNRLRNYMFPEKDGMRKLNPEVVGQSAEKIATASGIELNGQKPQMLVVEVDKSGKDEPLTGEKLSPTMAIMKVKDFNEGLKKLEKNLDYQGKGHTAILISKDKTHIDEFAKKAEASRMVLNTGAALGAVGLTSEMPFSLTLACGGRAKNQLIGRIANCTPENMVNYKNLIQKSKPVVLDDLLKVPTTQEAQGGKEVVYNKTTAFFGPGAINRVGEIAKKLKEEHGVHRILIVTDNGLIRTPKTMKAIADKKNPGSGFNLERKGELEGKFGGILQQNGVYDKIKEQLKGANIEFELFDGVVPNPTTDNIDAATDAAKKFGAQAVIAVGGGSPIDTAKSVAVLIKAPDKKALDLYSRKVDPNKGAAPIVAINTTHGTGSEFTQFAVGTIPGTGHKPAIFSRMLRPEFSIDDPNLMLGLPKKGSIFTALDAVAHSFEAATTIGTVQTIEDGKHTPNIPIYTVPFAKTAIGLVAQHLPELNKSFNEKGFVDKGNENLEARHNILYASMLAGMSFDDKGFLHLGHALEHPLSGLKEDLAHGDGLAILMPAVVETTFKNKEAAKIGLQILQPVFDSVDANVKGDGTAEDARKAGVAMEKWIFNMGVKNKADIYMDTFKESVAEMTKKPVKDVTEKDVINKLVQLAEETPGLDNLLQCAPVEPTQEVMKDIFKKALMPYEENQNLSWQK